MSNSVRQLRSVAWFENYHLLASLAWVLTW